MYFAPPPFQEAEQLSQAHHSASALARVLEPSDNSPGHEVLELVGDEHPAHVQLEAGLVAVVVVHEAVGRLLRDEQQGLELHIALGLEVHVAQGLVLRLHMRAECSMQAQKRVACEMMQA